jgi:antibiotic biosynthesis monooxygenase (ABM) superfamily enzyme
MRLCTGGIAIAALLAFSAAAQDRDGYVDYFIAKVKPERRADFDALARKFADANRKANGDRWIASKTEYGDNDTVYFSSARDNMAAIETGSAAFEKALKQTFGASSESMMQDMMNCLASSRSEIRRRRFDLSSSSARDLASIEKIVGAAHFIRTLTVRVRPGHEAEFEETARMVRDAADKKHPGYSVLAYQSAAGQTGSVYFFSILAPSFGAYDEIKPMRDILSEEEYRRFTKTNTDCVLSSETMIARIVPAMSNPPEAIVEVSRSFWLPGATAATMADRSKDDDRK